MRANLISLTDPLVYLHILLALALLILPGCALYFAACRLLRETPHADLVTAMIAGTGLSIALWPLLLLFATVLSLTFFQLGPTLLIAVALLYLGYEVWARRRRKTTPVEERIDSSRPGGLLAGVVLLALTLTALVLRVSDAQGLVVPLFGDSLHHTMIVSLIMEQGGVPGSYLPYVPVDTFTYHFGFHSLAATFAHVTGTTSHYSVLFLGQVLNALSVPLAYLLNMTLFTSRAAGLFAATLTGFVSLMPAFYVNWGRYTQLSGQLLLVVALAFLVRLSREKWRWSDFALTTICVAGLVVVHYRVLIFFGLFAIALAAWTTVRCWGEWRSVARSLGRMVGATSLGLLLALPWIINLVSNYVEGLVRRLGTVTSDYLGEYNNPATLLFFMGRILPAAALFGLTVALFMLARGRRLQRRPHEGDTRPSPAVLDEGPAVALVVAAWLGLMVLSLYVVPGAIGSYTVAIMLYLPLSALGGYGFGVLLDVAVRHWSRLRVAGAVVTVALLALAPVASVALGTARVADPGGFNYVQRSDLPAFDWIKANTPSYASFLISSEFSYTGRAVTASDAGMWLPLFTGRNVSVPALNSWMERPLDADFFADTRELAAYTQPYTVTETLTSANSTQAALIERKIIEEARALSDQATLALMRELGVTHVYVGSPEGWSQPRLDIEAMRRDPAHFALVYAERDVYIFRVLYE